MTLFFSETKQAFYNTELGYSSYPEDIIEISNEQYAELFGGMSLRNKSVKVVKGVPTLVDKEIVVSWVDIRSKRDNLLQRSDYTQLADWPGDTAAWATYRQELRDITSKYDSPEKVVWPTPPGE